MPEDLIALELRVLNRKRASAWGFLAAMLDVCCQPATIYNIHCALSQTNKTTYVQIRKFLDLALTKKLIMKPRSPFKDKAERYSTTDHGKDVLHRYEQLLKMMEA